MLGVGEEKRMRGKRERRVTDKIERHWGKYCISQRARNEREIVPDFERA